MGTAYTPGLTVSGYTLLTKTRRLPLKGEVLVSVGDEVTPQMAVAKAAIPGIMNTVKVAELLGQDPEDVPKFLKIEIGHHVQKGDIIAESRGLFGLIRNTVKSPLSGTVEVYSQLSGHLGIREEANPLEVNAYIAGTVTTVIPEEGVVISAYGALVQGIFGVGGERYGEIAVVCQSPNDALQPEMITSSHAGKVIIGGSFISGETLKHAVAAGVSGIVVGGMLDTDLAAFLGSEIGVAITGDEEVGLTLILTEGFGHIPMAQHTFDLFKKLDGQRASINGATQIRAGVIRPEVVVPCAQAPSTADASENGSNSVELGRRVRIIREPNFGQIATVIGMPADLVTIPSGAHARVYIVKLEDGTEFTLPRANVELITE
ncbi:MAG: hypothetical protein ACYC1M_09840 [Armatimonadota bacterium]